MRNRGAQTPTQTRYFVNECTDVLVLAIDPSWVILDASIPGPYPDAMATLVIEHSDLTGADRLGETLRAHGHRLDIRRMHRGDDLPADLEQVDAIIVCGK